MWDGKIRLFNRKTYEFPAGLYDQLEQFCNQNGYNIQMIESEYGMPNKKETVDPNEIMRFIKGMNLHSKGKPIEIRDFQFNAICSIIQDRRKLLISPTGSGKSLIIYVAIRFLLERLDDKILLVVPTTSLVDQMFSDFGDYSSNDDSFDVAQKCHKIYSGKEKTNVHEQVFISTWQSIFKLGETWFRQFGAVFGDEAHLFDAKSMSAIMEKSIRAEYRIGTTGTLKGTKVHELALQGLFGKKFQVTTTKKLQDNDTLAQLVVNMIRLKYPSEIKTAFKTLKKLNYQKEIEFIVTYERRNEFIVDLAQSLDGNTLILFQFVKKHGKVLQSMIEHKIKDRRLFYVSGEVEQDDREAIRAIVEKQSKSIILASNGVFSTGVNIKNIHNIIFANPSKSQVRVLQSIGRGLRKSDNGKPTRLFDLVDDIRVRSDPNFAWKHAEERRGIYHREEFKLNEKEYQL